MACSMSPQPATFFGYLVMPVISVVIPEALRDSVLSCAVGKVFALFSLLSFCSTRSALAGVVTDTATY
ncbi:hypothetical protein EXIGLDRAFT_721660, partial [Exidia glandulosa HHB12029]